MQSIHTAKKHLFQRFVCPNIPPVLRDVPNSFPVSRNECKYIQRGKARSCVVKMWTFWAVHKHIKPCLLVMSVTVITSVDVHILPVVRLYLITMSLCFICSQLDVLLDALLIKGCRERWDQSFVCSRSPTSCRREPVWGNSALSIPGIWNEDAKLKLPPVALCTCIRARPLFSSLIKHAERVYRCPDVACRSTPCYILWHCLFALQRPFIPSSFAFTHWSPSMTTGL